MKTGKQVIFSIKTSTPEKQRSACAVVGVYESRSLSGVAKHIDELTGGALRTRLRKKDLTGKQSQTAMLYDPPGLNAQRLLLVGCGKKEDLDLAGYRKVCGTAAAALIDSCCRDAAMWLLDLEVKAADVAAKARHLVEAMEDACYRFDEMKSSNNEDPKLQRITVNAAGRDELEASGPALAAGVAVGAGKKLARDLANLPGNVCTPEYLAQQARQLQQSHGFKTRVLEKKDMERLKMGALLSVARGSRQPPKLIVMEYHGGKRGAPPIALVGKGLTFDAGGISIKPAANMDEMKYDMCGAASVFGAMVAAAELKLPINVVGVVPSSENLPDGDANKPGDIVTTMSGKTVEVLNTDAEGRLILCDALTYTEKYNPAVVIDIATLTGACVIALGSLASGLMANDQSLADELLAAGEASLDRAWQLPLWQEYQPQLDSNFADMANIGGREAGAITAGCFLSRFTESFKWAHLDIAGTAWKGGKEKGATGRVVPILTQYLIGRSRRDPA
jgi:leucyl aminopeptidase